VTLANVVARGDHAPREEAEEWLALSCQINSPKAGSDSQPANWWMRLAEHSISKNSHHAGRKKRGKSD
jgi:hypothetical protein